MSGNPEVQLRISGFPDIVFRARLLDILANTVVSLCANFFAIGTFYAYLRL